MRLSVKLRGNALAQLDRMLDFAATKGREPPMSREAWAALVLRQKAGETAQLAARLAQTGKATLLGNQRMPPMELVAEELPKVPLESDPEGNLTLTVGDYLSQRLSLIWAVEKLRAEKLGLPPNDDLGLGSPGAWVGAFLSDKIVEGTVAVDLATLQQEAQTPVDLVAELERQRAARLKAVGGTGGD
jgi:hypothetical protein